MSSPNSDIKISSFLHATLSKSKASIRSWFMTHEFIKIFQVITSNVQPRLDDKILYIYLGHSPNQ